MKTVRFTHVVDRCGKPEPHALWVAPKHDPEFMRAQKANRVMTVESSGHGKADIGIVGFSAAHQEGSQFLIFPKSLKPFAGARIIGIKFEELEHKLERAQRASPWSRPRKHRTEPTARSVTKPHAPKLAATLRERKRPPKMRRAAAVHVDSSLREEVLAALEEMRRGQSVAAYERLRRAIDMGAE